MSQANDQIFGIAIRFLKSKGIVFEKCESAIKVPRFQIELWRDLFEENCSLSSNLWQVNFLRKILSEDEYNSANSFSVFVDEVSG